MINLGKTSEGEIFTRLTDQRNETKQAINRGIVRGQFQEMTNSKEEKKKDNVSDPETNEKVAHDFDTIFFHSPKKTEGNDGEENRDVEKNRWVDEAARHLLPRIREEVKIIRELLEGDGKPPAFFTRLDDARFHLKKIHRSFVESFRNRAPFFQRSFEFYEHFLHRIFLSGIKKCLSGVIDPEARLDELRDFGVEEVFLLRRHLRTR